MHTRGNLRSRLLCQQASLRFFIPFVLWGLVSSKGVGLSSCGSACNTGDREERRFRVSLNSPPEIFNEE